MHTRHFRAALAAAAILVPLRSEAELAPAPCPTPAFVVVNRLLAQRERLSLRSQQVTALMKLSDRLRADRRRLELVGLHRVQGKPVPRYIRVFPTSDDGLRLALDLLTPEQRMEATRFMRQVESGTQSGEMPGE